ncbi:MAG: hypothetical protein LBM77_02475 [Spirochaetaceae bacterium]|jgi:hypothetical protein|nr:hypothetical protein [Spirochaetaceae bacterium]
MQFLRKILIILLLALSGFSLFAQQHVSVPLDSPVYSIIDTAALRGIVAAPGSSRPWTELTVSGLLQTIIDSSKTNDTEKAVAKKYLAALQLDEGFHWKELSYSVKAPIADSEASLVADLGINGLGSVGITDPLGRGLDTIIDLDIKGDMGNNLSYGSNLSVGVFSINRQASKAYNDYDLNPTHTSVVDGETKYGYGPDRIKGTADDGQDDPTRYTLTGLFPYTFNPQWDGPAGNFKGKWNGYTDFPDPWSFGYQVRGELNASFLDNRLFFGFGRIRRDYGPAGNGASLVLNANATPFFALEMKASPFDWLHFSALSGILERSNWDADEINQNAFSLNMIEIDTKYFYIDIGSSVVWPKRFELGYLFPMNMYYIYQMAIGDNDDPYFFGDIVAKYPGVGKLWLSASVTGMELGDGLSGIFNLDRSCYALQAGTEIVFPWLPFASVQFRWTKLEPYMYTHKPVNVPWYTTAMEQNYTNNAYPLGYYLNPNSDEFLLRLESLFLPEASAHVQYQLIRHGAEYGPGKVDGSSPLDYDDYQHDGEQIRQKYFLKDGAYSWQNVIKLGASYDFSTMGLPLKLSLDAGLVITSWTRTNTADGTKQNYRPMDGDWAAYYKNSVVPVITLGFKVF